jgi:hypothetical protein
VRGEGDTKRVTRLHGARRGGRLAGGGAGLDGVSVVDRELGHPLVVHRHVVLVRVHLPQRRSAHRRVGRAVCVRGTGRGVCLFFVRTSEGGISSAHTSPPRRPASSRAAAHTDAASRIA